MHIHNYRLKKANVRAFFRKDNWPEDMAYIIPGDLKVCPCGSARFKPYQPEFTEVEVILPTETGSPHMEEKPVSGSGWHSLANH